MKYLLILSVFVTTFSYGAPCGGAPITLHVNSNGSPGGSVAKTASVSKSAFLDATSSVCGSARVNGSAKIINGSEISGQASIDGSPTIDGSKIYGSAVVTGGFRVVNSVVCQASKIVENVIRSDYYCQTDDPEPKHPGENGNKTLLGVDSDADGVRDDVEIWINQNTSNTPNKDMYNQRMALKQVARLIQLSIVRKDIPNLSVATGISIINSLDCLRTISFDDREYRFLSGMLKVQSYNTKERLYAWAKTEGSMNGISIPINNKKDFCEFTKK